MAQDGFLPYPKGFATAAIHQCQDPENWKCKAVVPPIVTSSQGDSTQSRKITREEVLLVLKN
nr:unnamed protein product [Callosobruchus analis]